MYNFITISEVQIRTHNMAQITKNAFFKEPVLEGDLWETRAHPHHWRAPDFWRAISQYVGGAQKTFKTFSLFSPFWEYMRRKKLKGKNEIRAEVFYSSIIFHNKNKISNVQLKGKWFRQLLSINRTQYSYYYNLKWLICKLCWSMEICMWSCDKLNKWQLCQLLNCTRFLGTEPWLTYIESTGPNFIPDTQSVLKCLLNECMHGFSVYSEFLAFCLLWPW